MFERKIIYSSQGLNSTTPQELGFPSLTNIYLFNPLLKLYQPTPQLHLASEAEKIQCQHSPNSNQNNQKGGKGFKLRIDLTSQKKKIMQLSPFSSQGLISTTPQKESGFEYIQFIQLAYTSQNPLLKLYQLICLQFTCQMGPHSKQEIQTIGWVIRNDYQGTFETSCMEAFDINFFLHSSSMMCLGKKNRCTRDNMSCLWKEYIFTCNSK